MNTLDVTIRNHEDVKEKMVTSKAVCIFVGGKNIRTNLKQDKEWFEHVSRN